MKSELINMTQTWDKEKILFPDRNQTQDPSPPSPEHQVGALSTGLQELMGSKVTYLITWLIVTSILRTVRISTVKVILIMINE